MKKQFCLLLALFFVGTSILLAQNDNGAPLDIGLEVQVYPTGIIPGLRAEMGFGAKSAMHLRLGYQLINHRDLGVHESEKGTGFGVSVGYKYYFKEGFNGFFGELRNDFWWNTLDWKDNIDQLIEIRGTSRILVVQPTLKAGYAWLLGDNDWVLAPSIAFGYEINVQTEGSDVGEGAIILLGLNISKRF